MALGAREIINKFFPEKSELETRFVHCFRIKQKLAKLINKKIDDLKPLSVGVILEKREVDSSVSLLASACDSFQEGLEKQMGLLGRKKGFANIVRILNNEDIIVGSIIKEVFVLRDLCSRVDAEREIEPKVSDFRGIFGRIESNFTKLGRHMSEEKLLIRKL